MLLIPLWIVFWLLLVHWLADFICQTDWMAKNKSSDTQALTAHVLLYTFILLLCGLPLFFGMTAFLWAAVNGCAHWLTDFVTSKITKKLWEQQRVHDFFVVVGLDQVLHYVVLFWSTIYFLT